MYFTIHSCNKKYITEIGESCLYLLHTSLPRCCNIKTLAVVFRFIFISQTGAVLHSQRARFNCLSQFVTTFCFSTFGAWLFAAIDIFMTSYRQYVGSWTNVRNKKTRSLWSVSVWQVEIVLTNVDLKTQKRRWSVWKNMRINIASTYFSTSCKVYKYKTSRHIMKLKKIARTYCFPHMGIEKQKNILKMTNATKWELDVKL